MEPSFFNVLGQFIRWLNDRNCVVAFFSLLTIVVLAGALADEQWVYLNGGHCPLNHLGATFFYGWGYFEYWDTRVDLAPTIDELGRVNYNVDNTGSLHTKRHVLYRVGRHTYVDCVTPKIVDFFHGLMGVCVVALACSVAAFLLAIFGARKPFSAWLQRTSMFNILTVIVCMVAISVAGWMAVLVEEQQRDVADKPDNVETAFEDGFYLVTSAAILSVCAIVANVVKSTLDLKERLEDQQALIDNTTSHDNISSHDLLLAAAVANPRFSQLGHHQIGSTGLPPPMHLLLDMPPPPPYSP